MNNPITDILTATKLATGVDVQPVDRLKVAQARRVAAILMREQRGMSGQEIRRVLGLSRGGITGVMAKGQRPASVAEAVRQARKLLQGVHK